MFRSFKPAGKKVISYLFKKEEMYIFSNGKELKDQYGRFIKVNYNGNRKE